jgi:hypothetical protein
MRELSETAVNTALAGPTEASVSRRRPRRDAEEGPEQLALPSPSAPKTISTPRARARVIPAPEQAARAYIARRAKPSVVPGHVKLTFTFDMPRELAERLSAQAIRKGVNLEAVILERLAQ